jgi:amino acid transporter
MADKGLKSNVVGLFGGTMLGISSVAPAYALTATLGILAASVGAKTPVVIIAGFLPMFFAAYAYREFNRIMPDSGTSFTWTSKAFGPYIGWLGGWAAVLATIIGPWPLPGSPRLIGGQLDHHLLADIAHAARDGRVRRDA